MKFKSFPRSLKRSVAAVAVILVFATSASAAHQYKILHDFLAKPASAPFGSMVADAAGNLYGVASNYRSPTCGSSQHCGAVFKLTSGSGGKWTYSILHVFKGSDGDTPYGTLVFDSAGNLYGTTFQGGAYNLGTVFELSPKGDTWSETVLYSFGTSSSNDVQLPWAGVTFDAKGNLYGTAGSGGGTTYSGGVFELKPSGNGWQESVLYSFNGYDGSVPKSNVVFDSAGNLYSTTAGGGNLDDGVVFELTPSSDGHWTETVLYSFNIGPQSQPTSGVIFDAAGNLYGTTAGCGNCNPGAVYELSMLNGTWSINVLHAFNGSDGSIPAGGVIFDSAGNLYGTTAAGGKNGLGEVFKLSQSGGQWTESALHSFAGKDGNEPFAGLILDQGVLYGSTFQGGAGPGYGVVFSIVP
jgi:uncharacterized repeat protein (TIGR03803 family)